MQLDFGQRIKNFRKQANLSQFDLETRIGAAAGSISRIEAGKTHPTLDTIFKITYALDLNKNEITKLLEIADDPVSEIEISNALQELKAHYENPTTLSHLMDDRWYVRAFSEGFIELLGLNQEEVEQMLGQNIMILLFDPNSPYFKRIEQSKFDTFAEFILSRKRDAFLDKTADEWIKEVFSQLNKLETFKRNWPKVISEPKEYFSNESRSIHFDINGRQFKTIFGRETIKNHPRFYVVEYTVL